MDGVSESFCFHSLPLLIQQDVADLIVSNFVPSEALNFGLSSRLSLALFQRAKPRIELDHVSINFNDSDCEIHNEKFSEIKKLTSADEAKEFLTKVYVINSVQLNWSSAINDSFFPQIWMELAKTMKFAQNLKISAQEFNESVPPLLVSFLSRLSNCTTFDCVGRRWDERLILPVSEMSAALKRLRRLTFMRLNNADDTLLQSLAAKSTTENPLECLCIFSSRGFTLNGIAKLLENGVFGKTTKISLSPLQCLGEELLEYFKTLGTVESVPSRNSVSIKTLNGCITFCFPLDIQIPNDQALVSFDMRPYWNQIKNVFSRIRAS